MNPPTKPLSRCAHAWEDITWDDETALLSGDPWAVRQYGTCICGQRVYEEFISTNTLNVSDDDPHDPL